MDYKKALKDFFASPDISGGYSDHPDDKGGATMMDVTLSTYTEYCRKKGLPEPTKDSLKKISYEVWEDIFETLFWLPCKANEIENQVNACILVSWAWGSGTTTAIKWMQKALGLNPDGIIGDKTIALLEIANPTHLCNVRAQKFKDICTANKSQEKFLKGWLNRLEKFKKLFNIK